MAEIAATRPDARKRAPALVQSVNPANGQAIAVYPEHSARELEKILEEAQSAVAGGRSEPLERRCERALQAGKALRAAREECARTMALEMGKPLAQGRGEIDKCAWLCDYYAENGGRFLSPQPVRTDAVKSYVAFQPLGTVLAIMPWNFPFWQAVRCALPAILAGNAVLLKHASNVTGCALQLEKIFAAAGFDPRLFRSLILGSERVQKLIRHPAVAAVSITGSTAAGRAVAQTAGAALKKTVLELGGSDPYLVLADADLDLAAEACARSRLINGGQSCIAAKRFIVEQTVFADFEARFAARMGQARMGDPLQEGTTLGPLARFDLRDGLHGQVERSLAAGARLVLGGKPPDGPGAYYPPTILSGVTPRCAAYSEETFGPVAALIPARDEEDAVRIANDSPFGLGAAVFTRDRERGERIAVERLEAGIVFLNAPVHSDPRLPFGGVKQSGYGRELSEFGAREFANVKTVALYGD